MVNGRINENQVMSYFILECPMSWQMGVSLCIMSCLYLLYLVVSTAMANERITENQVMS